MKALLGLLLLGSVTFADEKPAALTMEQMSELVKMLSTQIQLQQFQFQERVRSDGNSGIKQMRIRQSGVNNYQTESHDGGSFAAIHTHSNAIRTVGMGEFTGVLNGVEFRTRHNDYHLVMPSKTSKDLHAVDDIPFPDVPPEVEAKKTVEEQVDEMREFFKAWGYQNSTHRDYTKYFKPVLCYLEGGWFKVRPGGAIQESFHSDRHSLDASSWMQLHGRAQFNAYTGGKNRLENLAMLPTAFMGTINGTIVPQMAQFNYRILCHPLKNDLPLKYLHVAEDLANRLFRDKPRSMDLHAVRRGARFQLNARRNSDRQNPGGQYSNGLLDEFMTEIPGKDNYPGKIESPSDDEDIVLSADGTKAQNKAYYHRYYQLKEKDAMGLNLVHRSYSDDFGFAAQTTQEKIAGMDYAAKCQWVNCKKGTEGCSKKGRKEVCPDVIHEKWTWAFPVEIIYMTPLYKWNPYKIEMKQAENEVREGGRNGKCDNAKQAFNGNFKKLFFRTPVELFSLERGLQDAADTVKGSVCVLSGEGKPVKVVASGTYIHLPDISGVGPLRVRYPILPVHGEGSSTWKELNALRHLVMNRESMDAIFYSGPNDKEGHVLETDYSGNVKNIDPHTHAIYLSAQDWKMLAMKKKVKAITTQNNGHTHTLLIEQKGSDFFRYTTCDGKKDFCFDKHPKQLQLKKL